MAQIATNVYRIPRRFNWPFVIGGFAFLALVLMWWRWGGAVGEALAYLDTARWLRGEVPLSGLRPPFSWRLGVPALAAALPGELHTVFGALNWLFVTATACLATATVRRMGFGTQRALIAGLLVAVSLPTAWYAPYLFVEPGSICLRTLFVFAVLTARPRLALAAALAATAVSEENILLLGWLLATRQVGRGQGAGALALALAWLAAVRWWIEAGVPGTGWPDVGLVAHRLSDGRGWLSLAACALPVALLAAAGLRHAPPRVGQLKSLLALMALPALYAALFVRLDGRIAWGLYPFLVPLAAAAGMAPRVETAPDVRQLRTVRRA